MLDNHQFRQEQEALKKDYSWIWELLPLILNIIIIIILILIIIFVIIEIGKQQWALQLLKNQCVAECFELNKINPNTCAC